MKNTKYYGLLFSIIFIIFMFVFPNDCRQGAFKGIILCGRIIIPSLFPFTVCVSLLMRTGACDVISFLNPLTKKVFNLNATQFSIFLLSLIGGYPIGAKLIEEASISGRVDRRTYHSLICCCINAGPAFTVIAVGEGLFGSETLGYYFFVSHIVSAFILLIWQRKHFNPLQTGGIFKTEKSVGEIFVDCVADSAASMLNICSFIIIFSTINAYLSKYSVLYPLVMLLEVTNGITFTKNIYLISFLLGFSGVSVWFQVISVLKKFSIELKSFLFSRLLHGFFSAVILLVLIKTVPIKFDTLSNNIRFSSSPFYSTIPLGISLFIMVILLIISMFDKTRGRNFGKDMI